MAKSRKSQNTNKNSKTLYAIHPWDCRHQKSHSEIVAYVEASSKWETVLTVHHTAGAGHEAMAAYVLALIHEHQRKQGVLKDALDALEAVINDGLTFTTEQAAERAVTNIKRVIS